MFKFGLLGRGEYDPESIGEGEGTGLSLAIYVIVNKRGRVLDNHTLKPYSAAAHCS